MNKIKVFLLLCISLISVNAYPQNSLIDKQMQIGFDEKQGQYVDLNVKLVNEAGDTVLLKNIITKPTILNLVYFNCSGTCSPLMWGVSKFIDGVDLKVGQDYDIITVSFDPTERINLGVRKKESYLSTMKKKDEAKNWQFFVSDSINILNLTKSVGFSYQKADKEFIHPTGLIALAADGKIVRYLRGIDFMPFDIKITMVEAAKGKIGPSINRLLAVCYGYDNKGNQYVFNVTRVSAIVISFIIVVIFLFLTFSRKIFKPKVK